MKEDKEWIRDLEKRIMSSHKTYSYDGQGFHLGFKKNRGRWWLILGSIINIRGDEAKTKWGWGDKLQICFAPIDSSLSEGLVSFLEFSEKYVKKFGFYPILNYKKILKEEIQQREEEGWKKSMKSKK